MHARTCVYIVLAEWWKHKGKENIKDDSQVSLLSSSVSDSMFLNAYVGKFKKGKATNPNLNHQPST